MRTILLVEDAQDLAKVIRRELEQEGYRVLCAADGAAGLQMFRGYQPDLVILDWMLPRLDALAVLREIRSDSRVPVLMLTARAEEADRVIGLEVGADDYLTKPFSMRELVARVRAPLRRLERVEDILKSDRTRHAAVLTYGPIELDPGGYRAALDGKDLGLTWTEFDLLQLLIRNPGRAFSRSYLLETVWDHHYVPGDRSAGNAVLRLRKKLGDWGDAIETVWGVGYRLRRDA